MYNFKLIALSLNLYMTWITFYLLQCHSQQQQQQQQMQQQQQQQQQMQQQQQQNDSLVPHIHINQPAFKLNETHQSLLYTADISFDENTNTRK